MILRTYSDINHYRRTEDLNRYQYSKNLIISKLMNGEGKYLVKCALDMMVRSFQKMVLFWIRKTSQSPFFNFLCSFHDVGQFMLYLNNFIY